jgi:hypothetical protein
MSKALTDLVHIGDVQAYAYRLEEALRSLGADPDTGTLPQGLTVI